MVFDLSRVVRPKIYNLAPYRCARDDFKEGVLLDANENSRGPIPQDLVGTTLHRYPDPHQIEFKTAMAAYRNRTSSFPGLAPILAENLCLGVGSDESIDSIIRACCTPGKEKILTMPPTYGMYSVCADINDVDIVKCPLITGDGSFQMDTDAVLEVLKKDSSIKVVFITSPGNPTGVQVETKRIEKLLQNWESGMVVVDEAYVDFCRGSTAPLVTKYPNLCVLQTLSKSFGLAGIRLGMTYASKEFAKVLNSMKAPYNISSVTSEYAMKAVQEDSFQRMEQNAELANKEQQRLLKSLTALELVEDQYVGGLDANFLLLRINKGDNKLANQLYQKLATESGVVVRYRGSELGCEGCLRITVGTPEENDTLIREFAKQLDALTGTQ